MTINDSILRYRLLTTQKTLEYEGQPIALFRKPGLIDNGAGGKKRLVGADVQLAPQVFLKTGLVTMGRGVATQPERWVITSLGDKYREFGVLIGDIDVDVEKDDYFFGDDGSRWEVLFIHEDRSFQVKAEIGRV